jgi:multidrug efflux system outer membrane protein
MFPLFVGSLVLLAPAQASTPLSLDAALGEALLRNPDLEGARLSVSQSELTLEGVRALSEPSLTASTQYSNAESAGFIAGSPYSANSTALRNELSVGGRAATGTSWSIYGGLDLDDTATVSSFGGQSGEMLQTNWSADAGVQLSQDLLAPFRRTPELQQKADALESLSQAELKREQSQQAVLADVAEAWWTWSMSAQRVSVAQDSVESARRLEELTLAWKVEGTASEVDAARVQISRLQADKALLTAQRASRSSADQLLLLIGHTPGEDIRPEGKGELRASPEQLGVDQMMAENLDLALLDLQLEAAKRRLEDAENGRLPSLNLSAGAGVASLQDTSNEALAALVGDERLPTLSAGLELQVPLGNQAAKNQVNASQVSARQTELLRESAERQVRAQLRAGVDQVETARSALEIAQAQVVLARLSEAGEEARLAEGTRRLDELLDARDARRGAEVELLEAQLDLARAQLNLAELSGHVDSVL